MPFLVTSCNHVFCEKHKNEKDFQSSSCPGCHAHLSKQGGARLACYNIQNETHLNSLNGLTPSNAVKVVAAAVEFWLPSPSIRPLPAVGRIAADRHVRRPG